MLDKHTSELATLVAAKKDLEIKIEAVKNSILNELKADNLSSYASPVGTVSFVQRKNYKYSDEVNTLKEKMEGDLAKLKNKERKTGVAEVEVTEFVQFREHDGD